METQNDSILKCSLLRRFVLNRIPEHGNQKLTYKTRLLNKERKLKIEKGINTAKVNLSNIQQLVDSNLSCQIKYLHIFVRGKLENLEKWFLHYATYFPNIKSINIVITRACYGYSQEYYLAVKRLVKLELREPLILQNMNISNKSNLDSLVILGNQFDVTIRDCNFDGLEIFCNAVATSSVCNTRFKNSKQHGLTFWMFKSLKLEQIIVNKSGGMGCYFYTAGGFAKLSDIRVSNCALDGIFFRRWSGDLPVKFEFENVHIDHSGNDGMFFCEVEGEIRNSSIKRCECYGINMKGNSVVRHASIQFEENEEGNTYVGRNSILKQIGD